LVINQGNARPMTDAIAMIQTMIALASVSLGLGDAVIQREAEG
jgi:hypothetical protein